MAIRLLIQIFIIAAAIGFAQVQGAYSQDAGTGNNTLERAKKLFNSGEEEEGLNLYLEVLDENPENLEALWNATVIYARMGYRQESEEEQKRYFDKAMNMAQQALEHHPESGYSHYAMAVAKGRMTEILDTGERIETSNEMKEHLQKASDNLPDFAPVWHIYGVWHSDVANVSGAAKTVAGIFSEGLPDASNEKAEEYLKRAISLRGDTILFRLDLAKHYLKTDRENDAKEVLNKVLTMQPKMKGDEKLLEEAEELLQDLT